MKYKKQFRLTVAACLAVAALQPAQGDEWPTLAYEATEHSLSLPIGWYLGEVAGVALNSQGHLFVFHRGDHQLLEFDADGKFIREIGQGLFRVPHGLRIDDTDNVWTTDQETHQVIKFHHRGEVALVLGRRNMPGKGWYDRGYDLVLLREPSDIGFDSEGNIYVADAGNFRIVKYDEFGEPLLAWGSEGSKPGEFNFPHSIVVDEKDNLYVTDRENGRIQVFSTTGEFMEQWDDVGHPYVVQLAEDNTIWMTDARAGKVINLDLKGSVIGGFGQWGKEIGDLGFGHGIALDANGDIFVGEIWNWRVQRFSPKR